MYYDPSWSSDWYRYDAAWRAIEFKIMAIVFALAIIGGLIFLLIEVLEGKYPKFKMWLRGNPSIPLTKEEYIKQYLDIFAKFELGPDDELSYFNKKEKGAPLTQIKVKDYIERSIKSSDIFEEDLLIQKSFENKLDLINWVKMDMEGRLTEDKKAELYDAAIYKCGSKEQIDYYENSSPWSPMDWIQSPLTLWIIVVLFVVIFLIVCNFDAIWAWLSEMNGWGPAK